MSRLDQLVSEIRELKQETNHRSCLRIFNLLENNRKLFLDKIDPDYFNLALRNFEALRDTPSRNYNTAGYIRDYQSAYESLMFHLNRII